ncbi:MAG TPA: hypothetical protein VFH89_05660 [Sphingomicrobium sp.]|nr:hypothetical protein [Sphingomicrobium sp.]
MKQLFGGILIAVGILIAGASGLCSLTVLFGGGFGGSGLDDFLNMLPLVALFGGLPLAAGIGIAFGGRAMIRSARRDEQRPN